jgi:hypothetical protein
MNIPAEDWVAVGEASRAVVREAKDAGRSPAGFALWCLQMNASAGRHQAACVGGSLRKQILV